MKLLVAGGLNLSSLKDTSATTNIAIKSAYVLLDMEKAPSITTATLQLPNEKNDLADDVKVLSSKGLYCFDVTDLFLCSYRGSIHFITSVSV